MYVVLSTWDTKDILRMDNHILIMTYKSLATGYVKCYILDTIWSPRRWLCDQEEIQSSGDRVDTARG